MFGNLLDNGENNRYSIFAIFVDSDWFVISLLSSGDQRLWCELRETVPHPGLLVRVHAHPGGARHGERNHQEEPHSSQTRWAVFIRVLATEWLWSGGGGLRSDKLCRSFRPNYVIIADILASIVKRILKKLNHSNTVR